MTDAHDHPEAARLREQIAADLRSLRQTFRRPAVSTMQAGDIPDQVSRILRTNPGWATAAAAGALAGLVFSVRNRLKRAPVDSPR
ncbi:MAG TPA: hypothetical protein VFJ45_03465 [bacterium]|nr:hypothetical protein [bacterium]